MTDLKEHPMIIKICEQLKEKVQCDFVGLAIQNEVGPNVRWHYASGNLNDKYKRITVRFGKGFAGKVISSGSPMMMSNFPQDILGKVTDYPIALAEKLVSSYAVPLFFNTIPKGVLLVGNRISQPFTEQQQLLVKESGQTLEKIVKEAIEL